MVSYFDFNRVYKKIGAGMAQVCSPYQRSDDDQFVLSHVMARSLGVLLEIITL
jgi:hypothetical protein